MATSKKTTAKKTAPKKQQLNRQIKKHQNLNREKRYSRLCRINVRLVLMT